MNGEIVKDRPTRRDGHVGEVWKYPRAVEGGQQEAEASHRMRV